MANDADYSLPQNVDQDTNAGNRFKKYRPLYRAAVKGDWKAAKEFFYSNPEAKTADITGSNETVLHVAAWAGNAGFVKKLLKVLTRDALEIPNVNGMTALHFAATGGNLEMVKALVQKNSRLTQIVDKSNYTPVVMAAFYAPKEVVRYLCLNTRDEPPSKPFTGGRCGTLTIRLAHSGCYDILVGLIKRYPIMAIAPNRAGENLLSALAAKPADFWSGSSLGLWEKCIYYLIPVELNYEARDIGLGDEEDPPNQILDDQKNPKLVACFTVLSKIYKLFWTFMKHLMPRIKHIMEEKHKHKYVEILVHCACKEISALNESQIMLYFSNSDSKIMYRAVASGIVEIVTICLQYFPNLLWIKMDDGYIIHVAIKERREKIFNLVYEGNAANKILSDRSQSGETALHLVAKIAPRPQLLSIPCPALQMQKELQWFKAVENFIRPLEKDSRNNKGEYASELFTEQHKDLAEEAEKWMRATSNSCMIVATLIATVVFAAAFTVPGGIDDCKGIPIFLNYASFTVFAISTAIALFSSITSVLMFLSILTARYAEKDFLHALPKRLILGLTSLFIAIAAMMVAFGSAMQIMMSEKWKLFYIPTMIVGAIPVALFMMLQFPLFIQMVWSTFGPSIFRPKRIW